MIQTRICKQCHRSFTKNIRRSEWETNVFCSTTCAHNAMKGRHEWMNLGGLSLGQGWNKGMKNTMGEEGKARVRAALLKTLSKETPKQRELRYKKIVATRIANKSYGHPQKIGQENPIWKDNQALYNAKHRWLQNHKEKTGFCQICGDKPMPIGRKKIGTEWANIGHQYDRNNPKEWVELCPSCHRKLDKNLLVKSSK